MWFEKRAVSIILVILLTIEIYFFSSIPGTFQTGGTNLVAVIYHIIVFFLFAFFLFAAITGKQKIKTKYIWVVLIISLIHAFLDEFHQMFVPLRDASIRDIIINSLGIFLGIIFYTFIKRKKKLLEKSPLSR